MKIKTNIRAGKGTNAGGASGAGHNSSTTPDVTPVYYPPVSRCVGI